MKLAILAALAALVAVPARAQTPWPVCQVDRFTVGGVATGAADPTFNGNSATPAMRLRRGGTCSVGILGPRLSMSVMTPPSSGTARIDGQRIHYDAPPGFVGDDTFTVRMFTPDRSQNNTTFLTFRVQVRDATPPVAGPVAGPGSGAHAPSASPRQAAPPAQRPTTQATRPAPAERPDVAARLRQIQQLREQNLITEDEYRSR